MQSLTRQTAQLARRSALGSPSRAISTHSMNESEGYAYLNKQRALRPSSPWMVYKPQMTWVPSIFNRVTGTGLSVGVYAIFLAHLSGPLFGAELDSAAMLSAWNDLPAWFKWTTKGAIASSAAFHSLNGVRHLGWDLGYFMNLKSSYMAGYVVLAASAVSTIGLLAI
ncbi:hypothetical protein JCM8547_000425 [Rhodosporidiobolus lusitaniae]